MSEMKTDKRDGTAGLLVREGAMDPVQRSNFQQGLLRLMRRHGVHTLESFDHPWPMIYGYDKDGNGLCQFELLTFGKIPSNKTHGVQRYDQ